MKPDLLSRPLLSLQVVACAVLLCLAVACTASGPPPSPALPVPKPGEAVNSADRLLFWINVRTFLGLSDADLGRWKDFGVDGFVASTQWLVGADRRFSPDPKADLQGEAYSLQRLLRDSKIAARAKAAGMKTYLGVYLTNFQNTRTPLRDWFDDAGWKNDVIPQMAGLAGAAKLLGFDGLALDQEMYPQVGDVATASWSDQYAGNTHTPAETQAMATRRGKQLMEAIVGAFPEVELQVYSAMFPDSWEELVQQEANGYSGFGHSLDLAFWDGMSSADGYGAIRFSDAIFYKTSQLRGSTWDTANQYNVNRLFALFSRRFSNWSYASSRTHISPFSWVDAGTSNFSKAGPPSQVEGQLNAFRIWGTGGEFLNYAQGLTTFDYGPYKKGLVNASTPAVVDAEAPGVVVETVSRDGSKVEISGLATDNLGIRAVRWSKVGEAGDEAAAMTWTVLSGSYKSGWEWQMDWSFDQIDVPSGVTEIAVTVEDIKGLTTTVTVALP